MNRAPVYSPGEIGLLVWRLKSDIDACKYFRLSSEVSQSGMVLIKFTSNQ